MSPSASVQAAPTVIRDDLLKDLAITPVLGRGYSLSTNTFQSLCMAGLVKTKPSYNFYYKYEELNEDGSRSSDVAVAFSAEGTYGSPLASVSVSASGSTQVIEGETFHAHSILVTIDIEVYYASVDEAVSKISDPAREILTNKDIPGFFDACGAYYVRSLNRRGSFISKFTYKDKSSKRDLSFEAKLAVAVKSMGGMGSGGSVSVESAGRFSNEASSKQLTIESFAFGLGKNENASLIAYDLPTFQAAIKDAFISMQGDDVGMVTSMEVVPWVENADFQRTIKLYDAKPSPIPGAPPVSPYAQKRILNLNGEFLAEVDRVARSKLNLYYRAKLCRLDIDMNWKNADGGYKPTAEGKYVLNFKTGAKIPFQQLDEDINEGLIEELYKDYQKFLYGSQTGGSGGGAKAAVVCVRDLLNQDISAITYREVESCKGLEKQLVAGGIQMFDEYCMPKLVAAGKGDPINIQQRLNENKPKSPLAGQDPNKRDVNPGKSSAEQRAERQAEKASNQAP